MERETSPNGKYRIEFDFKSEVGMGGPGIGDIYINGKKLNSGFMNYWIWSLDSEKLLLLEYLGRGPDRTRICVYSPHSNELKRYKIEYGFTIGDVVFDGYEIKHNNPKWNSIPLKEEDVISV